MLLDASIVFPQFSGPPLYFASKIRIPPTIRVPPQITGRPHHCSISQVDSTSNRPPPWYCLVRGGGAWAADGDGRGRGSIPGGERNLGGNATTAAATMAAATNRVDVVVINEGGISSQCHGNNILPPPSPHPIGIGRVPRPPQQPGQEQGGVADYQAERCEPSHLWGGRGEGGDGGKQ
jgi:hypothetical protein